MERFSALALICTCDFLASFLFICSSKSSFPTLSFPLIGNVTEVSGWGSCEYIHGFLVELSFFIWVQMSYWSLRILCTSDFYDLLGEAVYDYLWFGKIEDSSVRLMVIKLRLC